MNKLPITITLTDADVELCLKNDIKEVNLMLMPTDVKKFFKTLKFIETKLAKNDIEIVSVHSPFFKPKTPTRIEYVLHDLKTVKDTFSLAHDIGFLYENSDLPLVYHTDMCKSSSWLIPKVGEVLDDILSEYYKVRLCIENSTSIRDIDTEKQFEIVPFVVKELNKYTDEYVYSCLDICHANVVCRTLKAVGYDKPYELSDYFKAFSDDCALIHLANTLNNGYSDGEHGCAFQPSDKAELKEILKLARKYTPEAKIVLEVSETDYVNRPDALRTLKTVQSIG